MNKTLVLRMVAIVFVAALLSTLWQIGAINRLVVAKDTATNASEFFRYSWEGTPTTTPVPTPTPTPTPLPIGADNEFITDVAGIGLELEKIIEDEYGHILDVINGGWLDSPFGDEPFLAVATSSNYADLDPDEFRDVALFISNELVKRSSKDNVVVSWVMLIYAPDARKYYVAGEVACWAVYNEITENNFGVACKTYNYTKQKLVEWYPGADLEGLYWERSND